MDKTMQVHDAKPSPRELIVPAAPAHRPLPGPRAVGSFVPRLTRQAFERYGFSTAMLITDWAAIVGADVARSTAPGRLRWPKAGGGESAGADEPRQGRSGATLLLRVEPARALDIQYKARQIAERINAYFGYRAVAELRLVQAPLAQPAAAPPAPPGEARRRPPPAEVTAVADAGLRAALSRMATGLAARHEAERRSAR
jgi:hypothetical protein